MPAMEQSGGRRAVLYTRSDLPTPARKRRDAVDQELRGLAERGVIDSFEVVDWRKRVPVAAASPERERYETFEAWAAEAGVALSPFFATRLCYSMDSGEKREELVLPALCLAVYDENTISIIAPHADGHDAVSVEDVIDRLGITDANDDRPVVTVPSH